MSSLECKWWGRLGCANVKGCTELGRCQFEVLPGVGPAMEASGGLVSASDEWRDSRPATTLPTDSQARKDTPIARGCLDYFPLAIAAVARLSKAGNDKHNPGEPLHWSRGK